MLFVQNLGLKNCLFFPRTKLLIYFVEMDFDEYQKAGNLRRKKKVYPQFLPSFVYKRKRCC